MVQKWNDGVLGFFVHIVYAKLGQADAGHNQVKLMTKLAPEWVRTNDPVIKSPARYRWTTAPAHYFAGTNRSWGMHRLPSYTSRFPNASYGVKLFIPSLMHIIHCVH